jgi:hypothetical protein
MKINFRNLIYVVIVAACILGLCYLVKTLDWAGLIGISGTLAILYVRHYPRLRKAFDARSGEDVQPPESKLAEKAGPIVGSSEGAAHPPAQGNALGIDSTGRKAL